MDAGVPITAPIAGISVGLMLDTKNPTNYKLLTDIQGIEDHHGDMDFKVAGSFAGITAIQLDIKLESVPVPVLIQALGKAKAARADILKVMLATIPGPRAQLSAYAPRIMSIALPKEKIGMVIGSGGKTIIKLQEDTSTVINIDDDGICFITGKVEGVTKAFEYINLLIKEWEVGEVVTGPVVKIIEVGAIVEMSPFSDGMIHISELAPWRVEKVTDLLTEGDFVTAKIISVDKEKGRIGLSIKQIDEHKFDNKKPVIIT